MDNSPGELMNCEIRESNNLYTELEMNRKCISYSKNVFIPITNLCQNKCPYCGFRKEPKENAWIMSPPKIMDLAEKGIKAGCSEALITLGENPEKYEVMREKLDKWNYSSTTDYILEICEKILKLGLLPHTNPGIISEDNLNRLRQWNASIGLMLECGNKLPVHEKSPGKNPDLRIDMIEKAGKLKIPFTTGLLIGIGENQEDRVKSLEKIREINEKYGHIQEIIIQPFTPKFGTPMENTPPPAKKDLISTIITARKIMPDMNIQIPPNITPDFLDFIKFGANDIGGISNITPDFINPNKSWPQIENLKKTLKLNGFNLRERLPIYPKFTRDDKFMTPEIRSVVDNLIDENGYRK